MNSKVLNQDKPICRYFEEISQIPRESEYEEAISDYLINFAKERNLEYYRDDLLNVLIRKPASEGYEDAQPVILQAHVDMVCVKRADSNHNFRTDPIELVLDGNTLHAKDTSLGADDGFGVAYMLAILDDDKEIKHPSLECLFTTQEETSMGGARGFDKSSLRGTRFINLDTDEEDVTYVTTATSDGVVLSHRFEHATYENENLYFLEVKNVTGNVVLGVADSFCANAIKMVARILACLIDEGIQVKVCEINGGTADNKAPLEAKAIVKLDGADEGTLLKMIDKHFYEYILLFEGTDYSAEFEFGKLTEKQYNAMSMEESTALIDLIYLMPNNTYQYNIPNDMFETIVTFGKIETVEDEIVLTSSIRSLHFEADKDALRYIEMLARAFRFEVKVNPRYRSMAYIKDSHLRNVFNEVRIEKGYQKLHEMTCPGNLEMALFVAENSKMDVITVGPDHVNLHSYDESLDLESFERVYDVLLGVLARLID